jgi:GTP:adenosylcobinamide-phosphate guanylyltransferase
VQKLSLIFPMAGQAARFGYRFKPFLDVQGIPFIAAAFRPFRPWLSRISKVYFVFTREQDAAFDVSAGLDRMFADVPYETAILDRATDGPAQTLDRCLEMKNIPGPVMVCDCDHAVNVDDLMAAAEENSPFECAVPTWDMTGEPLAAWSVAAVADDGAIVAVAEKKLPKCGDVFRGVIGCYYFADAGRVRHFIAEARAVHLSDVIARYLETDRPVLSVPVHDAHFFGDPARLARVTALQR